MRVMWAIATTMGKCGNAFGITQLGSGGWIDACAEHLKQFRQTGELEIHVVALSNRDAYSYCEQDKIHYYLLDNPQHRGSVAPQAEVNKWKECIEQIQPDLIQIWGTEYSIGIDIQKAAPHIPTIFFIQGIMSSITEHPGGDMRSQELLEGADIMFLPKLLKMRRENKRIRKQVTMEREMIKNSRGIILDSHWACAQYKYAGVEAFFVSLPINKCFQEIQWSAETCDPYTIFTVAGRTPLKGLHILLKALVQVKKLYPNIVVKIPGNVESKKPHMLFEPIYLRYLRKMITKYQMENNVQFLGKLSPEQMAENMAKANVFIMPSCIENHSSTLREAMTVGCPCVTTDVGSVLEFAKHEENALVYRYNEYTTLAYFIDRIFSDKATFVDMGQQARKTILAKYPGDSIAEKLFKAYSDILKNSAT